MLPDINDEQWPDDTNGAEVICCGGGKIEAGRHINENNENEES